MKMKLINTVIASCALALCSSLAQAAVDCDKLFSTMPDHSKEKSEFAKQMHEAAQECDKKFPSNGKENKQTDECMTTSFTQLANKDNYLAAAELAYDDCHDGKMDESKKWVNSIVKNAKAPKADKDKAAEVLKGLDQK